MTARLNPEPHPHRGLSSLVGGENLQDRMWPDTLREEADQLMHPDANQDERDGISLLLYGADCTTEMLTLKTDIVSSMGEFEHLYQPSSVHRGHRRDLWR